MTWEEMIDRTLSECKPQTWNIGSYSKGQQPKGAKGRKNCTQPGKRGFTSRPVLAIAPNGKPVRRWASVTEAAKALRLKNRNAVINSCMGRSMCRGMVLMYEEDYVPWGDYHYPVRKGRDMLGRCTDGRLLRKLGRELTDEQRERLREQGREKAARLLADPNCRFGMGHPPVPVRCIDTGEVFPSVKAAAQSIGAKAGDISTAIKRGCRCRGHRFEHAGRQADKEGKQ